MSLLLILTFVCQFRVQFWSSFFFIMFYRFYFFFFECLSNFLLDTFHCEFDLVDGFMFLYFWCFSFFFFFLRYSLVAEQFDNFKSCFNDLWGYGWEEYFFGLIIPYLLEVITFRVLYTLNHEVFNLGETVTISSSLEALCSIPSDPFERFFLWP